jgi:ubiquitin C-terminal hydrolase
METQELEQAIEQSLTGEPVAINKRNRVQDTPVGLKNVGNTCYFNSLI